MLRKFSFAVISQPRFYSLIDKEDPLVYAVRQIKENSRIAFVVVLGDITQNGFPCQFAKAREILDGLNKRYIPLMGDRNDLAGFQWGKRDEISSDEFNPWRSFQREFGKARNIFRKWQKRNVKNFSFKIPEFQNTKFIVIDVGSRFKKFLRKNIKRANEELILVFSVNDLSPAINRFDFPCKRILNINPLNFQRRPLDNLTYWIEVRPDRLFLSNGLNFKNRRIGVI